MKSSRSIITRSVLLTAITSLRNKGNMFPYTADVAEEVTQDRYTLDRGIPVAYSWNAALGRSLKRHMKELRIAHVAAKRRYETIDGSQTTCSLWAI